MNKNCLKSVAMNEENPLYSKAIQRKKELYDRDGDIRGPFYRDYTRIIFSQAYRRLKHKTQVFFAVKNDHICTRIEHVNLVESTSYTIASYLGLNTELTKAIAVGHDLGHAPFGHGGERILSKLSKSHNLDKFWHEKNSLHFIDHIETLEDDHHNHHNLNLSYAVRDGIISHCGEMNQRSILPRKEYIDLKDYLHAGAYNPYTYEGCVVKMSDKIAYLARDIEDALTLKIIDEESINILKEELNTIEDVHFEAINNGTILNFLILDVCHHSSINEGIALSKKGYEVVTRLLKFNYKNIYQIDRVKVHTKYVELILEALFDYLLSYYHSDSKVCLNQLKKDEQYSPLLIHNFVLWLEKYNNFTDRNRIYQNDIIYNITDQQSYIMAILDYLSGMTDTFIVEAFNEILSF